MKLFINAGSVGKPENGDRRAGYAIVELRRHPKVTFHRVAYDVAADESGLPPHFADLLETGGLVRVPSREGVSL